MSKLTLILKRLFDIAASFIALIFLLPLMGVIAIAIKCDSRGPIFFRQNRLGLNGKVFRVWKFRTMVVGAEHMGHGLNVVQGDPRITKVGKVLRRYSLDELPQLINILLGQMSVVGPRPGLPLHLDFYDQTQVRRLEMKPGLTGLAQVSGRATLSWPERIKMDIEYIDHFSLWSDMVIIFKTFKVLREKTVYHPKGGGWDLQEIQKKRQTGISTDEELGIDE